MQLKPLFLTETISYQKLFQLWFDTQSFQMAQEAAEHLTGDEIPFPNNFGDCFLKEFVPHLPRVKVQQRLNCNSAPIHQQLYQAIPSAFPDDME